MMTAPMSPSSSRASAGAPASALPRWLPAAFFIVWTALAAAVVWWFAVRDPASRVVFVEMGAGGRIDDAASRLLMHQQLLPWVPWLLLAPYILWPC